MGQSFCGPGSCSAILRDLLMTLRNVVIRVILFAVVAGVCGQIYAIAQEKPPTPSAKAPDKATADLQTRKEFLRRAKAMTADIEQDAWRLSPEDQIILKAQLGSIWWK